MNSFDGLGDARRNALVLHPSREQRWSLSISKRIFDVICASLFVVVVAPIAAVIAMLVKLSSHGPVLFHQKRVGKNGEEFSLLKFRSMYIDKEAKGALVTRSGDRRITPIGRRLRKWKLDELPQVVNVLKGDMSFVGPRPDMLKYMETLTGQNRNILRFRPGMTSPASLTFRNEENELARVPPEEMEQFYINELLPQKIGLDLAYAEDATFSSDFRILLRTALSVFLLNRG